MMMLLGADNDDDAALGSNEVMLPSYLLALHSRPAAQSSKLDAALRARQLLLLLLVVVLVVLLIMMMLMVFLKRDS